MLIRYVISYTIAEINFNEIWKPRGISLVKQADMNGFVQNCGISIADALEKPAFYTKSSLY